VIEVRHARQDDAHSIQALLAQLGYEMSYDSLCVRLGELAESRNNPVLIASDMGLVVGLIAMHWSQMLHARRPVARIATLAVRHGARGRGIGQQLVEHGAELARRAGCEILEVTTAQHRIDAQKFYQSIGFVMSSTRLHRSLATYESAHLINSLARG
jgi:N-acetylglutamate synthase-like GNAT family acetyltransferase